MNALCPICAKRPPADGWTVCQGCAGRLDGDLERIAELTAMAAWTLSPRANRNQAATHDDLRAPINLAALDAALGYDILPRLEAWERMWREQRGLVRYGIATENETASVRRSVDFLRSNLPLMAEDADWPIDDMAADVSAFRWGVKADPDLGIAGIPGLEQFDPEREERRAGVRVDCPADHPDSDGRLCGYRLVVDPERPRDPVHCRRCGTEWTSQRLVLVAKFAPGGMKAWATAQELAKFLDVGTATIGKWARSGLVAKMRTPDGWVYDIQQASQAHAGVAG